MMNIRVGDIERLLRERKAKAAEVKITKTLRTSPADAIQAELLILRARAKLQTGRPEGGLEDILKAGQLVPTIFTKPHVQEIQADCYFARYELSALGFAEKSDWMSAEKLYRAIIAQNPDYENTGWVIYQLGRLLLSANQIEQATEAFHQALLMPSTVDALTSYAYERLGFIASYEQRNFRQAQVFLEKAIQTYPATADRGWLIQAHLLRGRILRDSHRTQEAVDAAETALKLASHRDLPRATLLEALLISAEIFSRADGQAHRVISTLEQYFQLSKRPPGINVTWSRAYEMLGDACFSQGLYERSAAAYLAALQYNPYHPWEVSIYLRAARAYYQQGLYDTTEKIVLRAIDSAKADGQPIDFRVYDLLGSAYYAAGKLDKAAQALNRALELVPPDDPAAEKIRQYRDYARTAAYTNGNHTSIP